MKRRIVRLTVRYEPDRMKQAYLVNAYELLVPLKDNSTCPVEKPPLELDKEIDLTSYEEELK